MAIKVLDRVVGMDNFLVGLVLGILFTAFRFNESDESAKEWYPSVGAPLFSRPPFQPYPISNCKTGNGGGFRDLFGASGFRL